jgi:hypothetical protein
MVLTALDPKNQNIDPKKLHRSAYFQKLLVFGDILLTILSENQRHVFFIVAGCYFIQFLFLVANIILLMILFTNTFPFKAGMVQIMLKEFRGTIFVYVVYTLLFMFTRGFGGVTSTEF